MDAEVDVRESKDGKLIVQHDPEFRHFYGVDRKVAEVTLDEIALLRAQPGNSRPLDFHELAKLAPSRIRLMIDTKEPSHSPAFYGEMERMLRENGLIETAFFIGTQESRKRFHFMGRLPSVSAGRSCVQRWIAAKTAPACTSCLSTAALWMTPVSHWRLATGARADIERLRKAGMKYFQIDSVNDSWLIKFGETKLRIADSRQDRRRT